MPQVPADPLPIVPRLALVAARAVGLVLFVAVKAALAGLAALAFGLGIPTGIMFAIRAGWFN